MRRQTKMPAGWWRVCLWGDRVKIEPTPVAADIGPNLYCIGFKVEISSIGQGEDSPCAKGHVACCGECRDEMEHVVRARRAGLMETGKFEEIIRVNWV